jgi:hypothetical protein
MNDITLHDAFVRQGCAGKQAPLPAVRIGAGAMWIDAYEVRQKIGLASKASGTMSARMNFTKPRRSFRCRTGRPSPRVQRVPWS